MKLYYAPGACSMSPHIVLREAGQKFDLVKVDLGTHKTESGADYYAINPKGAVPALELDNGEVLTEGAVIVQYVGDLAKNTQLMPAAGSMERVRENETLNWVAAEFHKSMGSLFNPALAEKAGDILKTRIAGQLKYLDGRLQGKDYLVGSNFTAADAYAFTILGWGQHVGVDVNTYPNVKAYIGRIAARPSVQATLKAEGLA